MQIKGASELQEDVLRKGLCVDCGACVGLCPYFGSYRGKIATIAPCTVAQGRCHAHCPKVEVDLTALAQSTVGKPYDGSPLGHYLELKKARAGANFRGQGRFQNGGAVSALVSHALKSGLIDAAALTSSDGLVAVPILAKTEAEVVACSGTKYMAAPTLGAVNEYARSGQDRIGVVGTPCQLTALAQMRRNPLERADFRDGVALTIGLFCTWAVDTRKFAALVRRKTDIGGVTAMDVPPPPANVMELRTGSEEVAIPLEEVRAVIPEGCAICPDMTAEFADISIGALEGDKGWNTLIVRTAKGASLVAEAVAAGYLELAPMPQQNRENLVNGATGKKKRALRKARQDRLLNTDPATGRAALLLDENLVSKILAD